MKWLVPRPGNNGSAAARPRSQDARDGRISQQKKLSAEELQFNVTVVQHDPFRVAVAHELLNMGHYQCLRGIAVEAASNIVVRRGSPSGRTSRPSGSSPPRKTKRKT